MQLKINSWLKYQYFVHWIHIFLCQLLRLDFVISLYVVQLAAILESVLKIYGRSWTISRGRFIIIISDKQPFNAGDMWDLVEIYGATANGFEEAVNQVSHKGSGHCQPVVSCSTNSNDDEWHGKIKKDKKT